MPRNPAIIAERVARAIIPDLSGRPLYLVQPCDDGMVKREMIAGRMGSFFPALDSALRPQLEASGLWRGPGVAVVVDLEAAYDAGLREFESERVAVGAVLHELIHWLDRKPSPESSETPYEDFVGACQVAAKAQPIRGLSHAFLSHGESFIRLCCHVWYRARHACYFLQPRHLSFGSTYAGLEYLHAPCQYIDALWEECELFTEMPLRKVATLPQPAKFTEMWNEVLEKVYTADAA